jgi:hypothetical protein
MNKDEILGRIQLPPTAAVSRGNWQLHLVHGAHDHLVTELAVLTQSEYRQDVPGLAGNAAVICKLAIDDMTTEEDIANGQLVAASKRLYAHVVDLLRVCSGDVPADVTLKIVESAKDLIAGLPRCE